MKVKFYLKSKKSKDETPIEFVIQHKFSGLNNDGQKIYKKIKRSTGLSIKPRFWNPNEQLARESFDGYIEINNRLDEIKSFIKSIESEYLKKGIPINIDLIKERLNTFFNGDQDKLDNLDLFSFAENLIKNKEHRPHARILKQTLGVLREFSEKTSYKVDFETITMDFYNKFSLFLNSKMIRNSGSNAVFKGYSINTKAKHISNLKHIMSEALSNNLHKNLVYQSKNFKAQKDNKVENIYLSDSEIEKLYSLDLTLKPRLEKVRDLFLIGCYTGLRFSDFTQIVPENISENILTIKTQKTKKPVKIPLRPEAKIIFEKYRGGIPKPISNQKMNDYLKELGKLAGINKDEFQYRTNGTMHLGETFKKYELITTHTARRSFATNCYNADIPAKEIMLITGHTTESEFFKYIKVDGQKNAEKLLNHPYFGPKLKVV